LSVLIASSVLATPGFAVPASAEAGVSAGPADHQVVRSPRDLTPPPGTVNGHSAPGAVTGQVRDLAGRPLSRICVTATGHGRRSSALTTSGGWFLIPGLVQGAYTLRYSDCTSSPGRYFDQWSGGAALPAAARLAAVGPGETTRVRSVALRPVSQMAAIRASASRTRPAVALSHAVNISGMARDRAGHPLKGICVWAYPPGDYFAGVGISTSRKGTYSYAGVGLVPGKYLVMFTAGCRNTGNYAPQFWKRSPTPAKATVLHLRSGQHARHINARLGPGGSLAGTVRSRASRQALAGICVFITSVTQPDLYQYRVVTRNDGSYLLAAMAAGRYRAQFTPNCGNSGSFLSVNLPHPVYIAAGKRTSHVDVSLPTAAEITGVVTDAHGTPVPGFCVWENGNDTAAVTGKDGSYSIRGLAAGKYVIGFVGGCGDHGSYAPQFYPGLSNPAQAALFSVAAGQVKYGVDARLLPGGTVTGTMTNAAGQPLPGGCASLAMPSALENPGINFVMPWFPVFFLSGYAEARRNGSYTIRDLPPGNYYAEFGPCDGTRYAAQWFRAEPVIQSASLISVHAGATTTGISAVLRAGGSISGTVRNAAGHLLSGTCVTAENIAGPDPFDSPPEVRAKGGIYRINGLPPGRYAVQFGPCAGGQRYASQWFPAAASEASARPVTVRSGRLRRGVSAILISGGSVSGRVVSAVTGNPPRGLCVVFATDSAGNQVGNGVSPDQHGYYRLPHLRAGRYDLAACGYPGFDRGVVMKKAVAVRGSRARTGVNITLPKMGSVAGHVIDGATSAAIPGICVAAIPMSGPGGPGLGTTGLRGNYVIGGLAPGTYQVHFTPVCVGEIGAVASQWYLNQASQTAAVLVRVTFGQQHGGVDAMLAADGGIGGTVTDATHGVPVAGICVTAAARGPIADEPPVTAVTSADGKYLVSNLEPGRYTVRFSNGCGAGGFRLQWYSGVSSRAAATPVAVTIGAVRTGIDASMHRR
jgi:Carboxypeptidase regulatory-like domain